MDLLARLEVPHADDAAGRDQVPAVRREPPAIHALERTQLLAGRDVVDHRFLADYNQRLAVRRERQGSDALRTLGDLPRSEEHTSELSHVEISYAVFCLKKKKKQK